jgi:hypothetical protein
VILDGSEPANDLLTDEPRAPGAIPIARAPRVERRDFVMNANDSFRFTNLAAPETVAPASPLWGDDAERPSVRTLANLAALAPGAGAGGPRRSLHPRRGTVDAAAVRAAIAAATTALTDAGLAPDVALGDVQRAAGPAGAVAVPGGRELDGVANVVTSNHFDATALPIAPVDARYPRRLRIELHPGGRADPGRADGEGASDLRQLERSGLAVVSRSARIVRRGALRSVPLTDAAIAADPAYRLEELDAP